MCCIRQPMRPFRPGSCVGMAFHCLLGSGWFPRLPMRSEVSLVGTGGGSRHQGEVDRRTGFRCVGYTRCVGDTRRTRYSVRRGWDLHVERLAQPFGHIGAGHVVPAIGDAVCVFLCPAFLAVPRRLYPEKLGVREAGVPARV